MKSHCQGRLFPKDVDITSERCIGALWRNLQYLKNKKPHKTQQHKLFPPNYLKPLICTEFILAVVISECFSIKLERINFFLKKVIYYKSELPRLYNLTSISCVLFCQIHSCCQITLKCFYLFY